MKRVDPANSGGTAGTCSGVYIVDFLSWLAARPTALGNPLTAGRVFNMQRSGTATRRRRVVAT